MTKQLCVVAEIGIRRETVGAYLLSDYNVYQEWVGIYFRPLNKKEGYGTPFLHFTTAGQQREHEDDKFDEGSLVKELDYWKKRVNVGDKVELERKEPVESLEVKVESITLVSSFFEDLFKEMYRAANKNRIHLQVGDTWCHSTHVWACAKEIADRAIKNGHELDIDFLKRAAYVHDFGRMIVGSDASKKLGEYYRHGIEGRDYFLNLLRAPERILEPATVEEADKMARICERHVGGAGFTRETNRALGLSDEDTLAETIEEKIVGYADWVTHAKEIGGEYPPRIFVPTKVDYNTAISRTKNMKNIYARQIEVVENLHKFIQEITT